ncbi:hypothetical protein M407DRAFT_247177 [Tulasnella calospora MUT 4182]|uniref:Uncharacterized protein n=1 Tax=Tulasnella calospora MUT 4182 TaxID=1051891 RepID=A0A0C3L1N7_9AGAM|nr:hypothetical protein M407DRAFT_247191 [Tulasnella calospora MUT 4182]KIO15637.1 hypothetical protein M407DRAFT_247177 [Tulasnella calospora MUT 4182]
MFEKIGIVYLKVRVAGKQVVREVTPEDMRDFEKLDTTFSNRPTATHALHCVEKADHSFIEHYDEVVNTILGWWDQKTKGTPKDGVWLAGVKPKL